jgi:hypothetical protein
LKIVYKRPEIMPKKTTSVTISRRFILCCLKADELKPREIKKLNEYLCKIEENINYSLHLRSLVDRCLDHANELPSAI